MFVFVFIVASMVRVIVFVAAFLRDVDSFKIFVMFLCLLSVLFFVNFCFKIFFDGLFIVLVVIV